VRERSCSTGRYSTETVMKIADQRSATWPYWSAGNTWLATEK
jgi:hypothetical protein